MEQIKVILVDDEYEFIKSLSERFRMRDIESDIAFNGDQALQFLAEEMPDADQDGFTDYVTNYEFDQRIVISFHPKWIVSQFINSRNFSLCDHMTGDAA